MIGFYRCPLYIHFFCALFCLVLIAPVNNQLMNSCSSFCLDLSPIERPMKIEIVIDPTKPLPLSSRVAPAPAVNSAPAARSGVRGRRGRGGPRRNNRAPKTAADLDAEMEDYTGSTNTAAAAPAPAAAA
ncbi:hypothetical protein BDQ17DRAFT_991735 [Cyathus striatus]|nr:hypothetical protein BDQ17DRAFT_991735 [Cyathus striatus]